MEKFTGKKRRKVGWRKHKSRIESATIWAVGDDKGHHLEDGKDREQDLQDLKLGLICY